MPHRRSERFLQPGEYAVGHARQRLRTLLGSCVSVTLWHPEQRVGAMCHFLLASRGSGTAAVTLDGRYGDEAIELMLRGLRRRGVDAADCQAGLYGGGNMFPQQPSGGGDVGRRNGEAARAMLRALSLRAQIEDLFGIGHRQIAFDIATGQVQTRQVKPLQAPPAPPALPS